MGEVSEIRRVAIDDLKPYENNAKIHGKKQLEKLVKSIREFGFISPVLVDKELHIIAGHGRTEAAKLAGLKEIPVVIADGLTEEQRKAYILADNKLAELSEWDKSLVNLELQSLSGFDMSAFDLKPLEIKPYGAERERTNDAYNLRLAHESFLTDDFWQMPTIYCDEVIPSDLIGFNYAKTNKEKNVGVHCFVDDYQFERLWNDPEKYVDILKEYECFLSPDFSLYMDMPMPMKIWNIYRSRVIGAFYQRRGIPVIPTISWAEEETFDFCFQGIPENSIVAVSTIGVKENETITQIWEDGMSEMIKRINPKTILLYGGALEFDYGNIEVVEYKNKVTENWH